MMPKEQSSETMLKQHDTTTGGLNRAFDSDGLVIPRKLANPCVESREKKDLHREMLWKMKFGSNDTKDCELQKAYASYANRQRMKAIELEQSGRMTFEKLLEEQRQRLQSVGRTGETGVTNETTTTTNNNNNSENTNANHHHHHHTNTYLLMDQSDLSSSPTTTTATSKNQEFYRVFSKVRARNTPNDQLAGSNDQQRAKAL
ncbi:hypothetical protein BLOT_012712 [Blomia tropicalis]|nr:hypothetical protein BLOT_012712 [Blomia tropicalis]